MILLIGAHGFVGSAFGRLFAQQGVPYTSVTRESYAESVGSAGTVLINASASSRKYLADTDWYADFEASVRSVVLTIRDFAADRYVLISSVDVYNCLDDPDRNSEDAAIDPLRLSSYGFHKYIAEACVRRHATRWLVVRLAGMVGPGLKKNPVFDVLHGQPLRIHPDSQYQFMSTDAVARVVWRLIEMGYTNRVINVCGSGLISPREMGELAGRPLVIAPEALEARPRVVHINNALADTITRMPETRATVAAFINQSRVVLGIPQARRDGNIP